MTDIPVKNDPKRLSAPPIRTPIFEKYEKGEPMTWQWAKWFDELATRVNGKQDKTA